MFYVGVYILILLWLLIGLDKRIDKKLYIAVPLIVMAIIIGLRFETGRDLTNYRLTFYSIVENNNTLDVEWSFVLLSKVIYRLGFDFQMFIE